jgi:hypothetical protein
MEIMVQQRLHARDQPTSWALYMLKSELVGMPRGRLLSQTANFSAQVMWSASAPFTFGATNHPLLKVCVYPLPFNTHLTVLQGQGPARIQYAQVGNISNGEVVQVGNWALENLVETVSSLAIAVGVQQWFVDSFINPATRFVGDAVLTLANKLFGQGAIPNGSRVVVAVVGVIVAIGAS